MAAKRDGNWRRRRLEFDVIREQVRKHKDRFIARLQGLVRNEGACIVFIGSRRRGDYGRMNFRYKRLHVQIDAHRLFLILKLKRPIKVGYEAGHTCANTACVLHLEEQKWRANLDERDQRNGACPF